MPLTIRSCAFFKKIIAKIEKKQSKQNRFR